MDAIFFGTKSTKGAIMELERKIGNFLQLSDIPSNSLCRQKVYGYITLDIVDTMYSTCLSHIQGNRIKFSNEPPVLPYEDMDHALQHFKLLNIVSDVDKAVCTNLQNGIKKPIRVHEDVSDYVNTFANMYLKYRHQQMDCDYILTALDSEIFIFTNCAGINMKDVPYTSSTTFRSTQQSKRHYVFNEVMALKRLKELLTETYVRIKDLTFKLQELSLKLRSQRPQTHDEVDLEL